jgi:heme-degrading monooxygenase HmoA
MFVTILQGHVAHENWERLQQQYEHQFQSVPEGLINSFLVQGHEQPTLWKIITFWQNEEFFERARGQKKTSACEVIFIDVESVSERASYQVRRGYSRI